jgi:hypothetical protein
LTLRFAEDDWKLEADAATNSISYSSPEPNKVTWSATGDFRTAIGTKTTLDETPPSFTQLKIKDPTAANDAIIVTFQLNEAGTAYCRATRTDSGETAGDMPVNRILTVDDMMMQRCPGLLTPLWTPCFCAWPVLTRLARDMSMCCRTLS